MEVKNSVRRWVEGHPHLSCQHYLQTQLVNFILLVLVGFTGIP